jgi:hypothetical protein
MNASTRSAILHASWLLIAGAVAAASQPGEGKEKMTAPDAAMEACALLTAEEVQSVLGEPVMEAKPSRQRNSSLLTTQCFYSVQPSADSVAVTLAVPDPTSPSGPKEFWRRNFHPSQKESSPAENEEKDHKAGSLEMVDLGDEAYWVRNRFGGSLYVLKGDAFFIISLGGKHDEAARINKAKTLAKDALKRIG